LAAIGATRTDAISTLRALPDTHPGAGSPNLAKKQSGANTECVPPGLPQYHGRPAGEIG
jgi:hypothetical protein